MTTPHAAVDTRRLALRFALVALVVPLVVVAVGVIALVAAAGSLPDPVGIHWGANGQVDGFGPLWVPTLLLALVGGGIAALMALPALGMIHRGGHGPTLRILGVTSLAMTVFLTVMVAGATLAQRGLADARDAPDVLPFALIALGAAAVCGVAGWFALPKLPAGDGRSQSVPAMALGDGERAVWMARMLLARPGRITLGAAVALVVLLTIGVIVATPPNWSWAVMILATLVVIVGVSSSTAFDLRIDDSGLSVVSLIGWPRTRVPAAEITAVSVVQVYPLGDFGGWGWRWSPPRRTGIVLRAGEGIEVTRTNGRTLTVTVDDAAAAAALLQTVARHAHATDTATDTNGATP